jgi:5-histidylcysteine sulfoxide synthase
MHTRQPPTPFLAAGHPETKKDEIRSYFEHTFDLYDSLFDCLAGDESFYARPEPLRHPLIFYFGHTATFYINKLELAGLLPSGMDPKLEAMLAVGVDEMAWDDLDESHYDWPTVERLVEYRAATRQRVLDVIDGLDVSFPLDWDDPWWTVMMGCEHERIHLETSSVLIRQLDPSLVTSHPEWSMLADPSTTAPTNTLVDIDGGLVELGRPRGFPRHYGWDNEFGSQVVPVRPLGVSRHLVSNAEFLAFVDDGGYDERRWWSAEGWGWRQGRSPGHPVFWERADDGVPDDGRFRYRTMLEVIDLPLAWPVDVNHHEAEAFCRWRSANGDTAVRLPTEAEWLNLHDQTVTHTAAEYPNAEGVAANLDLGPYRSACPVDEFAHGELFDVTGNVWQWTRTPVHPFDGFEVHPLYDDFSTPTFDDVHAIIKGGSWVSTGNEALARSRYAFRKHFFQHAGFRYVANA